MRPQAIRKALDAYAQRNMAGTPDLGPAVRQSLAGRAVTDGRIHVESPGRRMGLLVPAGLLVLLLAAFVLVPLLRPAARQLPAAAPAAGLASGGLGSPNSGAATQDPTTNEAAYVDQLTHNLAIRLGTDEGHLNAAFQAAAQETLDQAVRDGKLPANQATTAKALAAKGLAGVLVTMFQDAGGKDVGTSRAMEAAYGAIVPAVSALFGLTAEQFAAAIEGGQTLQTLKAAHGTSDQQVRDAAMAGVRTALANGVQAGQWTNAEADTAAHMLEANLDNVLLKLTSAGAPQSKGDIQ
ncbi:MAG TPA: hypothetical protein VM536_18055, partial [Chloroflexia bacterium]|nr:hypothetical protein [Chloroflexia bacterium]